MTSYSEEFKSLVSRIVPGQPKTYYQQLYRDMLEFIENDTNGEGNKMRH